MIDVILVKDVPNLGHVGDQVSVSGGYGRNFLLPNRLAIPASTSNARRLKHERAIAERLSARARAAAQGFADRARGKTLEFRRKVGEQRKLFGSVTAADIAEALGQLGIDVDKRGVQLASPIKELGIFEVHVRIRRDVEFEVRVAVIGED